jgi:hypothetical protein
VALGMKSETQRLTVANEGLVDASSASITYTIGLGTGNGSASPFFTWASRQARSQKSKAGERTREAPATPRLPQPASATVARTCGSTTCSRARR